MASEQGKVLTKAAKELRVSLGLSQQAVAVKLGLSIGAVANYERGDVASIDARPLYQYFALAQNSKKTRIAKLFHDALRQSLGIQDKGAILALNSEATRIRENNSEHWEAARD